MKFLLSATVLSLAMMASCSFSSNKKRLPASVMKDVGVIGPNGEVLIYFREGEYVIFRSCQPNTILGSTPAEARMNCQGKTNKVPVETFKAALRNLVSTDRLNVLKPLTPEEIIKYNQEGPNEDQIHAMEVELDKINAFIENYGPQNANLVRKEELIKALNSLETRTSAFKKINTEVENAISLITNDTKLTLTKFDTDNEQFLYTVLKNFDPSVKWPCGLNGSFQERIKDCSIQDSSRLGEFFLVTRTKEFIEVYWNQRSGYLWSDRLSKTELTLKDAHKTCKSGIPEVANISGFWRLPSLEEYLEAHKDGIRTALPNMDYYFWTSTYRLVSLDIMSDLFVGMRSWGEWTSTPYPSLILPPPSIRCIAPTTW